MNYKHLNREAFWQLVRGERSCDREVAVLHLVVCQECLERFEWETGATGLRWLEGQLRTGELGWGGTQHTARLPERFAVLSSAEVGKVVRAEELAAELLLLPRAERLLKAANLERYRSVPAGLELLRQARGHWSGEPAVAEAMAETSVAVFTNCLRWSSADETAMRVAEDCLARAWGSIGNSRRVQGHLQEAVEALRIASHHMQRGTGDPVERGWWLRFEAALQRDRREFGTALNACRGAKRAFQESNLKLDVVWMEVQEAMIESDAGRLEEAITLFKEFLARYELEEVGVDVYRVAQHNLAETLVRAGDVTAAREILIELGDWASGCEPAVGRKVMWTEGLILEGEGRIEEAAGIYSKVQESFWRQEANYDTALVSLDLVRVQLKLGLTREARRLAETIEPIFRAKGIGREAAVAGLLVVEAVRKESATVGLVGEVTEYLRRVRSTPTFALRPLHR